MISKFSLYKREVVTDISTVNAVDYDIFISAFEPCERVTNVFAEIKANKKIWLIFPQYDFSTDILPSSDCFRSECLSEDEYFKEFFENYTLSTTTKLLVDITGFIRPHLIYFLRYLVYIGIKDVSVLYSEPKQYAKAENTTFSGFIEDVRVVPGCGASTFSHITDNDMLILGVGYDDKLISKVAQFKRNCKKKYEIFGFPSLQPDMYQESVLKSANVRESVGENILTKFAPAHDPFLTAELISNIIEDSPDVSNIYLSPLSSKPQVLGFAFYFCLFGVSKPVSIIYPYSSKYSHSTCFGLHKTWIYELKF